MGARGYPNLFATGEVANGRPLVDRQHPHDLFMELAARVDYRRRRRRSAVPLRRAGRRAGAGAERVHAPRLGALSAAVADHAPLVRFDAHHLRRRHRGLCRARASSSRRRRSGAASRTSIAGTSRRRGSIRGACARPGRRRRIWAVQVSHGRLKSPRSSTPARTSAAPPPACNTPAAGWRRRSPTASRTARPATKLTRVPGARRRGRSTGATRCSAGSRTSPTTSCSPITPTRCTTARSG